ncbi:hypothetical protein JVT61DRAFT_13330 [Boletus reticuloceps]|uniref:Uncharacterized protein n=1 Tax=Boletus reticuloceps TaxID=495285 RepID=A0A8I2YDQ7_9AGAM|nr:hypothetical protein JVT61DRAFT_13330 [Boletus reticuloceps]
MIICMSILFDKFKIETHYPYIIYPSTHTFLEVLDQAEPHWHWSKQFRVPLTRMGVKSLDDIDLVTLESLHLFFALPPVLIMDFFSWALETIQAHHQSHPLLVAQGRHH